MSSEADGVIILDRILAVQEKVVTYTARMARITERGAAAVQVFCRTAEGLAGQDLAALWTSSPDKAAAELVERLREVIATGTRVLGLIEEVDEAVQDLGAAGREQTAAYVDALNLVYPTEPESHDEGQAPT